MENGLSLNNSTVHQVQILIILDMITINIVTIIFVIVLIIVVIKMIMIIMVTITTIIKIIIVQGEDDGKARWSGSQMYSFALQLVDVCFSCLSSIIK